MDRLEVPRTRGDRPQVMARLMARSYNRLVSGKSFGEASGSKVPAGRHPGSSLSLIGVEGLKSHAFSRASLSETRGNPLSPSPTRRPRGPLRTYEIGVPTITTDARIRALAGVGRLRIWHSQRLRRRQRAKPSRVTPSLKGASSRAACSSVITATPCAETGSLSMSRVVVSYPAIRGGTTSAKGSE